MGDAKRINVLILDNSQQWFSSLLKPLESSFWAPVGLRNSSSAITNNAYGTLGLFGDISQANFSGSVSSFMDYYLTEKSSFLKKY